MVLLLEEPLSYFSFEKFTHFWCMILGSRAAWLVSKKINPMSTKTQTYRAEFGVNFQDDLHKFRMSLIIRSG